MDYYKTDKNVTDALDRVKSSDKWVHTLFIIISCFFSEDVR